VSHNFTVVRNTMPMFVWSDRKLDWRIRDAWSKAHVGPTSIVMRDPVLRNESQVVFRHWNEEVKTFSA
jgi:hypothetical protein